MTGTTPTQPPYRLRVTDGARPRPIRVAQWATGAIGRTLLRGVLDAPDLELVALKVYGDRKVGRDAGDIARRGHAGVAATTEIADVIAANPDVVLHAPRLQLPYEQHDADICQLLRAGINVISTAGQHYPAAHGEDRMRMFAAACRDGGASLFGTGISPGVVGERIVGALTGLSIEVDRISIEEVLDASAVPDPDFVFTVMAMGSDPDAIDLDGGGHAELYGMLYAETIRFMADTMGVRVERIDPDHRVVAGTRDLDVPAGHIPAGTVAATEWRWHAIVDGRRFLTLGICWTMDPQLPDYAGRDHWTVHVEGKPEMTMTLNLLEPTDGASRTTAGQFATAAPALRAIPLVVDAAPGVITPTVFAPFLAPSASAHPSDIAQEHT